MLLTDAEFLKQAHDCKQKLDQINKVYQSSRERHKHESVISGQLLSHNMKSTSSYCDTRGGKPALSTLTKLRSDSDDTMSNLQAKMKMLNEK